MISKRRSLVNLIKIQESNYEYTKIFQIDKDLEIFEKICEVLNVIPEAEVILEWIFHNIFYIKLKEFKRPNLRSIRDLIRLDVKVIG